MMAYEYINKIDTATSADEVVELWKSAKKDITLSQLDLMCVEDAAEARLVHLDIVKDDNYSDSRIRRELGEYEAYLKAKGYNVNGENATLIGHEFVICHGYRNTPMGKKYTFWLESK